LNQNEEQMMKKIKLKILLNIRNYFVLILKKKTGGNTNNHEKHVADNSVSAVLL